MPVAICETSPLDEDGNTLAAPFAAGVVPNTQPGGNSGAVSEGQVVLTNGINVGGRAGSPSAPGALEAGAHTLDVQAGQGVRLQIVNTATTRFFRLKLTDGAGGMIQLVRVGGQGGLLDRRGPRRRHRASGFDHRYQSGEILLDPGDRADVVFAVPPAASGVLTLWTKDFERVGTERPVHGSADRAGRALQRRRHRGLHVHDRRPAHAAASRDRRSADCPSAAADGDASGSDLVRAAEAGHAWPGHPADERAETSSASTACRARMTPANPMRRRCMSVRAALCRHRRNAGADRHEHDRRAPSVPSARLLDSAYRSDEGRIADLYIPLQGVPGTTSMSRAATRSGSGSSSTIGP